MEGANAVGVVIDITPLKNFIEQCAVARSFDTHWLTTLSIAVWEHGKSYDDTYHDVTHWLQVNLPHNFEVTITTYAAYTGMLYHEALRAVSQQIGDLVCDAAEVIDEQYGAVLEPYIYEGGWTVTSIHYFDTAALVRYDRTNIHENWTATESLLFRLNAVYTRVPEYIGSHL